MADSTRDSSSRESDQPSTASGLKESPFLELTGMRIVETSEKSAVIELTVTKALLQGLGVLHGGMTGALIDTAIGAAVWAAAGGGSPYVSIEFKVNHYQPARLDDVLTTTAEVLHRGRSTAAGYARVTNQHGKLIAYGTGTYMRVTRALTPVTNDATPT